MTTPVLKKQLHKAIDLTDDSTLLEAVYNILSRKPAFYDFELSPEQEKLVESRKKLFKDGKLKTVSLSAIRKKVLKKN